MEDHSCQKIFDESNIRIFKNKKYFHQFRKLLLTVSPLPVKPIQEKIKIYNNLKLKYSIIKKNNSPINYWKKFYEYFFKFKKDSSIVKEKYLLFYSRYILKKLIQLEIQYSLELDFLKQEYLVYCYKKMYPKIRKSLKVTDHNLSSKNSTSSNDDLDIDLIFNNTKNNATEKNNQKYSCWSLNPRNSIEKELYNLKVRSSKEIVDGYIGNINVDNIFQRKVEIKLSYRKYFGQKSNQKDRSIFSNRFKFRSPSKNSNFLNFNNYNKLLKKSENVYSDKNIIGNYKSKDDFVKNIYNNIIDESEIYNSPSNKKSKTINNPRRYCYKTNIKNKNNKLYYSISPINKNMSNKKFIERIWLTLPLLKGNNNLLIFDDKNDKYCKNNIINKKYYINCNDLFY